jgi:prevent-host-death family protein
MPEIGIRELKNQASEIVRAVREERVEYVITHRGKPVAMIVPFEEAPEGEQLAPGQWWQRIREIGRLMEEETPDAKSALQQLREDREGS